MRTTHPTAVGELTLKASADHRNSRRVTCSVQHGVLTVSIAKPAAWHSSGSPTFPCFTSAPAALHRRTLPCACSANDDLHLTVWQVGQWRHAASPLSNETPASPLERLFPGRLPFDDKNVLAGRYRGVWGKCGTKEASSRKS
jgi:hypothetical protein